MNDEILNPIELDDEEGNEATVVSDTLYIALANKSLKKIPLAFTVPDNIEPVIVKGFTLAWTNAALKTLGDIQKATGKGDSASKNLPYTSLRGLLEVGLNDVARIHSNLGLSQFDLNNKTVTDPSPFIYLNGGNLEDVRKALRPILNEWITGFIKPFAEKADVPSEVIECLEELYEKGELLKITPLESQVLPWKWNKDTGTTKHSNDYDYRVLVDYVARAISGKEIFQGLGTMKRVISSSGSFTTGIAELITNPITLPDHTDKFSLVIRFEVVTYPSLHQPLLKIDVSKRRWFSCLKAARFNSGNLSGFVFSEDYQDRAFSYKVLCHQEKQGENKIWRWTIDKDFEALRRKLKLPMKTPDDQNIDGEQIALGKASTDSCKVMLTYRNGLQEGKHKINVGVPEIDKLEAFEAITKILEPLGFKPFENYSSVKLKRGEGHKLDDTASRMINLPTLLGAALEIIEKGEASNFTPKYLESFDDGQLNRLLNQYFDIQLDNILGGKKHLKFTSKTLCQVKELKALIQENQEAMRRLYPNEKLLLLFVFYEEQFQTELKLLKAIISLLWGGAFELIAHRLPAKTHGPRELLDGAKLKAKERSRHRIEAWEPTVKQPDLRKQRTFCLVMARDFYENNRPDDRVNKPSTRQALAKIAGSCVQFLLPIETIKEKQLIKLDNFFYRVQAALKDLLSAHSGRIDGVKEKVDKYLKDIPAEARPKEIIGITIVRKQRGRKRGSIESTFLPVAMRLKVETGECELCCAYEKGNSLQISLWSKFSDAIAFISQISPVKLADKKEVRQTRFMEFVKQIISNSVEEGNQPLVMIDSSNCVQLWPWLADARINANEMNLGQQHEWMQDEWQGARLVRIRQDLAPGIIEKKVRELAETSLEDTRTKEELTTTHTIDSASPVNGLFRLTINNQKGETNPTGCVAYLSVRNNKPGKKRGQSCYQRIDINTPVKKTDGLKGKAYNKAGLELHNLGTYLPFTGQWPTPNPLEIVVTLRQKNDDPDRLAALVESLRYGFGHYSDWSSLPAPLFFERVVRDYISEFAIEDEEMETEQDDLEE
ncbi:RNaseH domain-containing protein [Limnoraphis robusta]|uniref:RNaseH domain-containing protein n=1 Tax=Limnoraphis robusta CCNP1315 TaxID=3110306 RepID=A0ABU5U553_9CYAN|nr:RNaseH domain-containing protein [Limnoraphis robusta]MEA5501429.1 RNaseH domain-containing protein [Limnoraphis robusta BA-68 BA1]MEA5522259.1 RNaseH domain-containing protein [Limnoraphis robusta CCNP1315]MEA5546622.1 RNaseH domain-containing protein [Limnoraphis robusta CCNP1324]